MDIQSQSHRWFTHHQTTGPHSEICSTRDVFTNRLDTFYRKTSGKFRENSSAALLTAVVGELGNNCFDHNLGQWKDDAGCWFAYEYKEPRIWVVVADRGQGVLSSLRRVDPSLKTEEDALDVAFNKRLSGRSPEKRGNGLKFVRDVINKNAQRGLIFISGAGRIEFGGLAPDLKRVLSPHQSWEAGKGTFSLISWGA